MADINTKTFDQLVAEQSTNIQGSASGLVDLAIGSILRAIVEAVAAVTMWLQALILKVLALTRASTSTGTDLDSWMADFGMARLGATFATGQATFSRFTASSQAVVPIGALIQTADGSQQYAVVVDTTNTAYNGGLGGYVVGAGISAVTVPVQAVAAGAAGNAAINGIPVLAQAISGVDTVANGAALANGSDAETDAALRSRFVKYLASLSKATKAAIAYAVASVETGLSSVLVENEDYSGAADPGYFYVVIDDGSGEISSNLVSLVYAAIEAVRPTCVQFGVFGAVQETANVTVQIGVASGYADLAVANAVEAAISSYINSRPLGSPLVWSRLIQVAYDGSAGVTSVTGLQINGGTSDLAATPKQVIKGGSISAATVS